MVNNDPEVNEQISALRDVLREALKSSSFVCDGKVFSGEQILSDFELYVRFGERPGLWQLVKQRMAEDRERHHE